MTSRIGKVIHYFNKIRVAIVRLTAPVRVGMRVEFRRNNETFEQEITSIQIDHETVTRAPKGTVVGIKVKKRVHEGALVFSAGARKEKKISASKTKRVAATKKKRTPAKNATRRPARKPARARKPAAGRRR